MKTRTKNIRLMVNDDELGDLDAWLLATGLVGYPRSSAARLMMRMVIDARLKPTRDQIETADVSKPARKT